jgi:osmotically-inducible protein OsmY
MARRDPRQDEFGDRDRRDRYEERAYWGDSDMGPYEDERAYRGRDRGAPLAPLASAGGMAPAYWPYSVGRDPYADAGARPGYPGDTVYRGGYAGMGYVAPGRAGPGDEGRGGRGFMDKAVDEVQSWFGDDAAEQRREQDHRGKGPKGYLRSDERIAEDVNHRLTDDHMIDATDIEVTVRDREVTLDGTVDSRMAKRRAEDCADAVSGVEHVQNNLRVSRAGDTARGAET